MAYPAGIPGGLLGIDVLGSFILGGLAEGAEDIDDRLLVQMEDLPSTAEADGGDFRKLVFVFAELWLRHTQSVRPIALAFDVDTAAGQQQDMIGGMIDLNRRGFLDERYRTFLKMQILLLLTPRRTEGHWTGTTNNLVRICRTFLGGTPGDGSIKLRNVPPYAYILDIENLLISEIDDLAHFLCKAQYAGVLGHVSFSLAEIGNWDSLHAGTAIEGTGVWGSVHSGAPIADVLTWGTHLVIGGDGDC